MTPPNEPRLAIAATRETLEQFREFVENALACVEVQEQHAGRVKALKAAIKLLEDEQDKAAKAVAKQQETLQALRTLVQAEQEKTQEQLAALQAQVTEAKATIAEGQRIDKRLAEIRKQAAEYARADAAAKPAS